MNYIYGLGRGKLQVELLLYDAARSGQPKIQAMAEDGGVWQAKGPTRWVGSSTAQSCLARDES